MKASRICPFLLFLLFASIPLTNASQTLEITVETDKSTYLQGEISEDQLFLTLLMFVAVLVALGAIASALVFLMLRRFKRNREPPAVPRQDVDERYKKCVKCGRKISGSALSAHTAMPTKARPKQERDNPSLN